MDDSKKTIENRKIRQTKKTSNQLSVDIFDINGEKEQMNLSEKIFNVKVKPQLLALAVRVYLANQRKGNASTKTRGEVKGSTRKIYRQKGTGRARHGDIKAPIFVGGGIVGGPKPRDYSLSINKKQKRLALFGALTLQKKENNVFLFNDNFLKINPKTKEFLSIWKKIGLEQNKTLIVLPKIEKNNLILAIKNIPFIDFVDSQSLNTYQILSYKKIIFLKSALIVFENHFLRNENK